MQPEMTSWIENVEIAFTARTSVLTGEGYAAAAAHAAAADRSHSTLGADVCI